MNVDTKLPAKSRALKSIRDMLAHELWSEREPLPSEQALADRIKVARKTVRAALQDLQDDKVIRLEGRRRYVVSTPAAVAAAPSIMTSTLAILSDGISPPADRSFSPGQQPAIFNSLNQTVLQSQFPTLTLQAGERWVDERLRQLLSGRPRGLIVLNQRLNDAGDEEELGRLLAETRTPAVGYVSEANRLYDRLDTVASDHRHGCRRLTEWLWARGRRRILRFWAVSTPSPTRPFWLAERDAGYVEAMQAAGGDILPALEFVDQASAGDLDTLKKRFEENKYRYTGMLFEWTRAHGAPDAILMTSDGLSPVIAQACRVLGLEPNRDVWLAGYDNYVRDVIETAWEPTLPMVTVDKRNADIGRRLAETLLTRLAGDCPDAPRHIRVEPELIESPQP